MRKKPPASYLADQNVDDLGRMVLSLLSEVWILRDRMAVTEAILEKKGLVLADEIEAFEPTAEMRTRLDAMRDEMVHSVVGAPYSRLAEPEAEAPSRRRL